jgi:hypothetical protein
MSLSHVARPKENNATRQLSRCLSRATTCDKICDKNTSFMLAFPPFVLSRRTFSLRERDMRQAGYWTHSYHSDATTMSETDGERRRVMRGSFLEVWEGGGFFNSRACLDVDFF